MTREKYMRKMQRELFFFSGHFVASFTSKSSAISPPTFPDPAKDPQKSVMALLIPRMGANQEGFFYFCRLLFLLLPPETFSEALPESSCGSCGSLRSLI